MTADKHTRPFLIMVTVGWGAVALLCYFAFGKIFGR